MPSTSELVTKIINLYAPDYSRAVVLDLIDQKQRALCNNDCAQMTWLDWADTYFPVPFLTTVSGTLRYTISAANLVNSAGTPITLSIGGYTVTPRRIKNVFTTSTQVAPIDPNRRFSGGMFDWFGLNENWFRTLGATTFVKEPCVLLDKTNALGATVQFIQDPGTHDDRFYCEFYYEPIPLLSESIPLSVNGNEWEEALIDGVVGVIEEIEHGENTRSNKFLNYWIKKFTRKANANVSALRPTQMRVRECG